MTAPITNGRDYLLTENTGTVPNVQDALLEYFQPMVFGVVTKATVNFQLVESIDSVSFSGVWQPMKPRALQMRPEGQRSFPWFMVHATPNLVLNTDDVFIYLGNQYRVMERLDYRLYGYMQYNVEQDFTGSGP